jgi:hypothetical protein
MIPNHRAAMRVQHQLMSFTEGAQEISQMPYIGSVDLF